jgi:hypothetical protein
VKGKEVSENQKQVAREENPGEIERGRLIPGRWGNPE